MGAKPPPTLLTLLTLPAEIREQIWDYFLVSPTHRVLPVLPVLPLLPVLPVLPRPSNSTPSFPAIWTATRPLRRTRQQYHGHQSYATASQRLLQDSASRALCSHHRRPTLAISPPARASADSRQ
ncbi:hypothetical protein VC83_03369 [Pseudogymnoascus destructans]|uniref:Uncharacterized protein n=2 Tax=Pseudogymnoascus destructans TaxID=655981 RepID=L8FR86_PSED2|nr:uncharacterized protein VC83_03369 [Pseudogymnoascus destructans]ELR03495.1 hypothetical protein GMDG_01246 [Pseudogymnoascus destructans 20631-21]OAF60470.1 hypothetical protein VC83_03369 [Pseudogymnoascus destructans]